MATADAQPSTGGAVDRHLGLITTSIIFGFVVIEVLVASRMNVATATTIISSAGAVDVALGVLTASYSAVILILLFTVDAWRVITDWKPITVYLEVGLLLTTLVFVPFVGAVSSIAILVLFNFADIWLERWRGVRPEPWRAGGTGAIAFFIAVFLLAAPVWVPSEVISFEDHEPIVGYVVGIDQGWTTILVEDDRSILNIRSEDMIERLVCTTDDDPPGKSVIQLAIGTSEPIECGKAVDELRLS